MYWIPLHTDARDIISRQELSFEDAPVMLPKKWANSLDILMRTWAEAAMKGF